MRFAWVWPLVSACAQARATQPVVVLRPHVACEGQADRVEHALCVARRQVDHARADKDIILLNCANDKATQLEALKKTREDYPDQPHRAAIDEKAARLEAEVGQCIGED